MLLTKAEDSDRGASLLEYVAVVVLAALIAGALIVFAPQVGGTVTAGVERALCAILGDDCEPDPAPGEPTAEDPFLWEGVGDESDWERTPEDDAGPVVDQGAVDDAVELVQDFHDPDCWWWIFGCSGPHADEVFTELADLSQEELEEVFGRLSDEEIDSLMSMPSVSYQHIDDFWAVWHTLTPETRARVRDITGLANYGEPPWGNLDRDRDREYEYRTMEEGSLWGPAGEPQMTDVQQGSISDCWWMASMAAIAHTNPEIIQDMITENPDGTFTVDFPNGETATVTPDFPYDPDNDQWAFARPVGGDPAIWPMVLEKAYAETRMGYDGIENWFASAGMEQITGGDSTNYLHDDRMILNENMPLVRSQGDLQDVLQEGQRNNQPMVAATYHPRVETDEAAAVYQDHGLSTNHQYVIDEVNEDGSVVLRDPIRMRTPYTLTAEEFHSAFPLVHVHDVG